MNLIAGYLHSLELAVDSRALSPLARAGPDVEWTRVISLSPDAGAAKMARKVPFQPDNTTHKHPHPHKTLQ